MFFCCKMCILPLLILICEDTSCSRDRGRTRAAHPLQNTRAGTVQLYFTVFKETNVKFRKRLKRFFQTAGFWFRIRNERKDNNFFNTIKVLFFHNFDANFFVNCDINDRLKFYNNMFSKKDCWPLSNFLKVFLKMTTVPSPTAHSLNQTRAQVRKEARLMLI